MSIKPDTWIARMARDHKMIEPFVDDQISAGVISYGVSSYGYDVRVGAQFKVFTNVFNTLVDPKHFDPKSFVDIQAEECVIPPNSFALASTIEYFRIPRDILTVCLGKSTYARCGIIVNVTPFEPEWEGHVTIEISNTTPLPAKIYANEGIAQVLFFQGDEPCEKSYKDKKGKYQAQRGVTLPNLCRGSTTIKRLSAVVIAFAASPSAQQAPYPQLPSETPAHLNRPTDEYDFARRDVMIPMRDGVKLHTVILVPKGARRAPILLTRTPYDATGLTSHAPSAHLASVLQGYDNAVDVIVDGGYIRVVQDVRGKYGSEGDYVMNRPLRGPLNTTPVDHATDTYDTIDWLVNPKNVPESNGRVGILGISYDGFLPLMALVHPHPALKVSIPMNPMVDGWMGDDWFHNGAFRQQGLSYIHDQEATRDSKVKWWRTHYDDYDMFMAAGSAGELGRRHGMEQL